MRFVGLCFLAVTAFVGAKVAFSAEPVKSSPPLLVSVVPAAEEEIVETMTVTGTLVPREEILVAPEVEGLRINEVLADEGDTVEKGQVLARLSRDILDTQLLQNSASLARADSTIEQAKNQIVQAEATLTEARQALDRVKSLRTTGNATEVQMERAIALERAAAGRLAADQDGLHIAQADRKVSEAMRNELMVKQGKTEIKAPDAGIVSRRIARIGATASAAGEPLFRIIAKGQIELEAEIPEVQLARVGVGAPFTMVFGLDKRINGTIRLVSPEIDKVTRLGRIRVALTPDPVLRIGAFARGDIEVGRRKGIVVPRTAVVYDTEGAQVLIAQPVQENRQTLQDPKPSVETRGIPAIVAVRTVKTGLSSGDRIQIVDGISPGDPVIAKAGAFLRGGDKVRAVIEPANGTAKKADIATGAADGEAR